MNLIIIEDEIPAREKLRRLAEEYSPDVRIIGEVGSVRDAIPLLFTFTPDLILLDVQLSDGIAFDIFEQCRVNAPVIFTTAYDAYLTEAFAHNGIDYVLKPIQREKLYEAFAKYKHLQTFFTQNQEQSEHHHNLQTLIQQLSKATTTQQTTTYKERIIVQKGREYVPLSVDDIAYCYTENRIVSLISKTDERYFTDKHIADLEAELHPKSFFRLNRKYLSHIQAIQKFRPEFKGKIIVELKPDPQEIVLVSQERAAAFRAWMER